MIEGTVENSIVGRGCTIKKGAVIKNCVVPVSYTHLVNIPPPVRYWDYKKIS